MATTTMRCQFWRCTVGLHKDNKTHSKYIKSSRVGTLCSSFCCYIILFWWMNSFRSQSKMVSEFIDKSLSSFLSSCIWNIRFIASIFLKNQYFFVLLKFLKLIEFGDLFFECISKKIDIFVLFPFQLEHLDTLWWLW